MTVARVLHLLRDDPLLADTERARATDAALLQDFLTHHNQAAFAGLLRRHSGMVWGVCLRLLRQHQDAEDAFQATFLVLARKAGSIRPAGMVGNWLYGVAHHTALKARAMSNKRKGRERQQAAPLANAAAPADDHRELQRLLDEELCRLPDKYRAIVVLCDLEGRTRAEAARQLGLAEGTVAGRLTRARAMLARRLTRQGLALSGAALGSALAQSCAAAAPVTMVASALHTASQATVPGVISAKVAALTEGVLKTMFLQKLLRAGAIALVLTILLFGAAMALPWALAQSPSSAGIRLAVENPSAGQDTGAGKKVDPPKVQKKPSTPDNEEATWSKPEGGLQARLRLERGDSINGTPILRVVLDLRNVSTPKQVLVVTLSRPLSEKTSHFTVTDDAGKEVVRYNDPYDGISRDPEPVKIAAGDTLTYGISASGVGIPANEAALLDLGSSHNWIFKAGDKSAYYLQAKFEWPGFGTINVPKARIPTQPAADNTVKSESPKKGEGPLSGLPDRDRIKWDLKALEERWKIISTAGPDAQSAEVILLLEAKAQVKTLPYEFQAFLFDKDKVRIDILYVRIEGGIPVPGEEVQVAAGERLRVFLPLPAKTTWRNVRNVVIGSTDVPRD